ncbi:MAG TPA: LmbE family protein, partial [Chitinophagales bacterium]|nr:LmbE family protein [Chitinophagales bacterium]
DAETTGDLKLRIPSGWSVTPASIRIQGNEHTLYTFQVTASDNGSEGVITPVFHSHGNDYKQEITDIIYEHLPEQHIAHIASRPAMVLLMHVPEGSYAYIEGAGDLVLESLQAAGVNVEPLSVNDLAVTDLSVYDAIITGVRAYNVSDRLISAQPLLLQYVQQGGTLLVQYNTTNNFTLGRNADGASMGPYPFSLTRGRTTDENASPEFLLPDHPVWNTPDKITADDFEGWVQERGLYYADATADHYQAPLGFADPGEETLRGAILTTDYGQGTFIYTGLSFFRQLPAGVPGAYKLFFNMMTY